MYKYQIVGTYIADRHASQTRANQEKYLTLVSKQHGKLRNVHSGACIMLVWMPDHTSDNCLRNMKSHCGALGYHVS